MTNELNNFVTVLNNDSDFSWIESNGTTTKQKLQSWDSKNQMMWITFLNDEWEKKWFKLEHQDGTQVHWDEDIQNTIMDLARDLWGRTQFGIANTSQMLVGNAMRDNL